MQSYQNYYNKSHRTFKVKFLKGRQNSIFLISYHGDHTYYMTLTIIFSAVYCNRFSRTMIELKIHVHELNYKFDDYQKVGNSVAK